MLTIIKQSRFIKGWQLRYLDLAEEQYMVVSSLKVATTGQVIGMGYIRLVIMDFRRGKGLFRGIRSNFMDSLPNLTKEESQKFITRAIITAD